MTRHDLYALLVEDLLAAPGSVEHWQTFLTHLCDALQGSAASFISHDFAAGQVAISVTARTAPAALTAYNQHWHLLDPWAHAPATAHLQMGQVVSGDALIDRTRLVRTPYYNDFGQEYGIVQCLAGMIEMSASELSCISINGDERRRPFDSHDADLLSALMPQLQRALAIHRRLSGTELLAANFMEVVNGLAHGVLLVSAGGAVLFANRAAETILSRQDGLVLDHGVLRANTPSLTTALRAELDAAVRTSAGNPTRTRTVLLLPRHSGQPPLSVVVAPLPQHRVVLGRRPAVAALFITDPDRTPPPDLDVIQATFRLTKSEARLVACLAQGLSLKDAAVQLGLRRETVRTRLKVVFQKTGCHRQADLVRLVLASTLPGLA